MARVVTAGPGPAPAGAAAGADLLPPLRQDLALHAAPDAPDGTPTWTLHDPAANRFFHLSWPAFELLSRWHLGTAQAVLAAVHDETTLRPGLDDLNALLRVLAAGHLLQARTAQDSTRLAAVAQASRPSAAAWLLRNYLSLRVPLVRPMRWLQRWSPRVAFAFRPGFWGLIAALALLGGGLAARRWDEFAHTFVSYANLEGLLAIGLAMGVAKVLHELGHAFAATRFGCRVPTMGVAFLVMWPVLYTDTNEAWKLTSRRQRLAIGAAGMLSELALASVALVAWSVLPDTPAWAPLRSGAFLLATTTWVLTLAINASPFMRFDGYFLLSDLLDMQNLHSRSFALARTRLRNALLGWDDPDPEVFEPRLRRFLVAFAFMTWLYRLVVFVGIALAVYHYFFKLLGIFLFAVEVVWFIARPLYSEVKVWFDHRQRIAPSRRLLLGLIALGVLGLLAFPWSRSVGGEAWMHAEQQQLLYSPFPARVASLHAEGVVAAGTSLVVLDSPDTRSKAVQSRILADALALQLDQTVGRTDGQEQRAVLAEQLGQQLAEVGAQQAELQRLELKAPFAGELLDVDPEIRAGVWITANQPIGILIDPASWVVDALIEQEAVDLVHPGSEVEFYQRNRLDAPLRGTVVAIDSARAQVLPHPMLAAQNGGRIAASKQGSNGALVPRDALYRVRIRLDADAVARVRNEGWHSVELGAVSIAGERRSLLHDAWTAVAAVLVRESGF